MKIPCVMNPETDWVTAGDGGFKSNRVYVEMYQETALKDSAEPTCCVYLTIEDAYKLIEQIQEALDIAAGI